MAHKSETKHKSRFRATSIIALAFLFTLSSLPVIPSIGATPEVSSPSASINTYDVLGDMLQFTNTTLRGQTLFCDPISNTFYYAKLGPGWSFRTLAVYYPSNGTTKDLFTFAGTDIRSGIMAEDGSIIIALFNKTIYRSANKGVTFTPVLNMADGTNAWNMAVRGNYVYAAEYGVALEGFNQTLWRSSDNGKAGTWTKAATTLNRNGGNNHWHDVYVDPYTNFVWATHGDTCDGCYLSTDGVKFTRFGPAHQATSIGADKHNVYFASDPGSRVMAYNKTTHEWQLLGVGVVEPSGMTGSFYDLTIGAHGVLYLRSVTEGITDQSAWIYMSPDGKTLIPLVNQTNHAVEYDMRIIGPVGGWMYFGHNQKAGYIYRFKDITMEEARLLAHSPKPRTTDKNFVYESPQRAFNGESSYFSLGTEHVTNATLRITGVTTRNLIINNGAETTETFWKPSGVDGFRQLNASEQDKWNLSCKFDTSVYRSGSQSICVEGKNHTGYHGFLRLTKTDVNLPPGTKFTVSAYYRVNNTDPVKDRQSGAVAITAQLLYDDYSVKSINMCGGPGCNMIAQDGNMTPNQWTRCWGSGTGDANKIISWVMVDITVYGMTRVWVDDIMFQVGEHMTPCVPYGADHKTTNPAFTIGGKKYSFTGVLEHGQTRTFPIGDLCGLYPYSVSCGGSYVFEWAIIGTRVSAINGAFARYGHGLEKMYEYANNGSVKVHDGMSETINAATWAGLSLSQAPYSELITVAPIGGPLIISVDRTLTGGGGSLVWTAKSNAPTGVSAKFTISGLDSRVGYQVFVDDVEIYRQSKGFTSLSFTYSGPWSEREFKVVARKPPPVGYVLQADFKYKVDGNVVTFTDLSTSLYEIKLWYWNFGDGKVSTSRNPVHTYLKEGTYTVELVIQDVYGNTHSVTKTVTIEDTARISMTELFVIIGFIFAASLAIVLTRNPIVALVFFVIIIILAWVLFFNVRLWV